MRVFVVIALAVLVAGVAAEGRTGTYSRVFNENLRGGLHSFQSMFASDWSALATDYPKAYAFAKDAGNANEFDTAVTRDGRSAGFMRYVKELTDEAAAKNKKAAADTLLAAIFKLLKDATVADPPKYVSHAGDHDVSTMNLMHDVLLPLPGALAAIGEAVGVDMSKAEDKNYALFLIDSAHVLHDVGYMGLPKDAPKWVHAESGALIIEGRLKALFEAVLRKPADLALITEAIKYHNHDDFFHQEVKPGGDALIVGPQTLPAATATNRNPAPKADDPDAAIFEKDGCGAVKAANTAATKRIYKPAAIDKAGVFLSLLRIADNMDAQRNRLTEGQRDAGVVKCWARLAFDVKTWDADKANRKTRTELIKSTSPLCADHKNKDLVKDANHESFLHFFSNWIITGIGSAVADGKLTISFTMDKTTVGLKATDFPEAAAYQIVRMATATDSISLGTDKFPTKVDIKLVGFEAGDVSESLSAFHPRTAAAAGKCARYNSLIHKLGPICYAGDDDTVTPCAKHHPEFIAAAAKYCPPGGGGGGGGGGLRRMRRQARQVRKLKK